MLRASKEREREHIYLEEENLSFGGRINREYFQGDKARLGSIEMVWVGCKLRNEQELEEIGLFLWRDKGFVKEIFTGRIIS